MQRRSFTLRLPEELSDTLTLVASTLTRTQADVIRQCLEDGLDNIVESETFQETLQVRMKAQEKLLSFLPDVDVEDEPPSPLHAVD